MSTEVDWTFLAWSDLKDMHWQSAGKVCRAVYDLAEHGIGTLKRIAEPAGATHVLVVAPFMVYVSFDGTENVVRVWRVRRYLR